MNKLYKLPITNKEKWNEASTLTGYNNYFYNGNETFYIRDNYSMHDKIIDEELDFANLKYEGIQIRWNFRINLD